MIGLIRRLGITSDLAHAAAIASIGASIAAWATSRSKEDAPAAKAERWGIFVGLWAPTFFQLGTALKLEDSDIAA
jgi:hypothetical protein